VFGSSRLQLRLLTNQDRWFLTKFNLEDFAISHNIADSAHFIMQEENGVFFWRGERREDLTTILLIALQ
jgi:hypothetical protein